MQIRLGAQQADPLLLAAVDFLKARHDLPDVGASGECRTPIVRWAAEDDPWVVELIDALHDELAKQSGGSQAYPDSNPGPATSKNQPLACTNGRG